MAGVPQFAARAPPALAGMLGGSRGQPPRDSLDGPLGSKFKFSRAKKDSATAEWDPDDFVKPSMSSASRSGRRVIPSAASESTSALPPPPKALPRSNSFKKARAAAKEACEDDSDDSEKELPSLPTQSKGVPMTDPMHKRDVEVSYSAMGWGRC
uniref:Uncharacterized protein n=1 Tax=Prymnesium polylepis TaxID=72548 RepID=A0A7S4IZB6_9EUKA|mmetsp:Transcript_3698/g.8368  ORF Transcript_3698/g.8368 Transcript_3698/m.8368 type:complete len:154 (+) Transcript_3698:43-504(+)